MNILTFDIEEWHVYKIHKLGSKEYYLPIIDNYLNRILEQLYKTNLKATFFCLGTVAREYPDIIKKISQKGHEIGCHSDMHNWITQLTPENFYQDTKLAIESLEDIIGKKVKGYRAPAFSIGENNKWALEILSELGIEYDCSVFPAIRSFGGFPSFKEQTPCIIKYKNIEIKEFPIGTTKILGKEIAYSGGGYFRMIPYEMIRNLMKENKYVMTYFHIRDFDEKQKKMINFRYFKNYGGIKGAFKKWDLLINEFDFINVETANSQINWNNVPVIEL